MTIGTGTFSPSAKFWIPRPYVYRLRIARYGDTITQSGNHFTIHATPPDPTFAFIAFKLEFYVWSTNTYSLDFTVTEFWAKAGGVGPEIPLNFSLTYLIEQPSGMPLLSFDWFTGVPDYQHFDLPPQLAGYWLPKRLA